MGNRDTTKDSINSAATSLFLTKGLLDTTMEDIATQSNCTRRNVYRYYPAKEDLAFSVVIEQLKIWNDFQVQVYNGLHGSRIERLEQFLVGIAHFLENQKPMVRFMAEFDFIFKDGISYSPNAEVMKQFASVIHITEDLLENILVKTLDDGSIHFFCSPSILIPTITTMLWSMAQRISIRDQLIKEEFGFSGIDMILTQIEMYIRALETK